MNTTEAELKAVAKAAGASLERSGHDVPHTALLNALAAALNRRDWNKLKARVGGTQAAQPATDRAQASPNNPEIQEAVATALHFVETPGDFSDPGSKEALQEDLERALRLLTGDLPAGMRPEGRQTITVYRCQDCGYETRYDSDLDEVRHVFERVLPGEPMPDGQCPECGAVCHAEEADAELYGGPVKTRFWTDDRVFEAEFDARPYLAQAADEALTAIIEVGYRGDTATDSIAEWMADHRRNPEVVKAFEYLNAVNKSSRETIGFECAVDKDDFLFWMYANRREALGMVLCNHAGVRLAQYGATGRWGFEDSTRPGHLQGSFASEMQAAAGATKELNLLDQFLDD